MNALTSLRQMLLPMGLYDLSDTSVVSQELKAYAAGFALVEEILDQVEQNMFVSTASGDALARWEQLLGLPTQPEVSLPDRRETILSRLSIRPWDFTLSRLEQSVSGTGVKVSIAQNPPLGPLVISFVDTMLEYEDWDQLKEQILSFLPAHLEAEFDVGVLTWEMFDQKDLSFSQLDAEDFTWKWFDINGHKLGKEADDA